MWSHEAIAGLKAMTKPMVRERDLPQLSDRTRSRFVYPESIHHLAKAIFVAAAYYAETRIGFAITPEAQPISTLWPPNAILFAALLLVTPSLWWMLLLAVLPVHLFVQLTSGVPLTTSLGWYGTNVSEALIGA